MLLPLGVSFLEGIRTHLPLHQRSDFCLIKTQCFRRLDSHSIIEEPVSACLLQVICPDVVGANIIADDAVTMGFR